MSRRVRIARRLHPRGQAMAEYSTILMFMLTVVVLFSGTSVMKSMIEAISAYFQAHYFAIQFPM
jgi:hypothetical protein